MRLNPVPPSLKDNQRYIVFEIVSKKEVSFENVVVTVWNTSMQLFGEVGTSRFKLWVPSTLYDKVKGRGIIRTTHNTVEEVRAVLASIKEIDGESVIFYVLGVTGTIRSAKNKFLGIVDLRSFQVKG